MFHWICPECGREIAPTAKECPACDPAAPPAPAAVDVRPEPIEAKPVHPTMPAKTRPAAIAPPAAPEPAAEAPAPVQELVSGAPRPPAPVLPAPIQVRGRELSPLSHPAPAPLPLQWKQLIPSPEPPRAPRVTSAPLREPEPAVPAPPPRQEPRVAGSDAPAGPTPSLPALSFPRESAPPLAPAARVSEQWEARFKPAGKQINLIKSFVKEQLSLPGPTLPHELTSLQAAGMSRILFHPGVFQSSPKRSSWMLSFVVAAGVLAGTLAISFYAMPSLASPTRPSTEEPARVPDPPPAQKAEVKKAVDPRAQNLEVTGIRFVTDLPQQRPQIHYLVVNHSNASLTGLNVTVTLRVAGADSPLSQFSFRAPRLGPYESKEMASSIERFTPASLPDWRELDASVEIR